MTVDPSAATAAEPGRSSRDGATSDPALRQIGKYRLDRILGSGGMGVVWAAFDPDLERAVAIKLLHAGDAEPTLRARLLREARAMARLKHPNVLTVYEVGTDRNRDYIAMELVDGDSLAGWLRTTPSRDEILVALQAAGRGLAAAHAAGLVHRDFKPHNVLRSRDGHVYVTDFGLARGTLDTSVDPDDPAPGARPADASLASPLTQTGVLVGTPAYMAPEQFAGRTPDPRTDQFAFCVTAWEALVGARPFRGSTLTELEAASARGAAALAEVTDVTRPLPAPLRAVLVRGLEPAPDRRWPDMTALLAALADATQVPLATPARGRRRLAAVGGALAIAAVVGGGALFLADRGSTAAADPCADPEQAFATAWSPVRRDAIMRQRPELVTLGTLAILDDVRRQWTTSYRTSCAAPRTPAIAERLRCLDGVRSNVHRVVDATARGESTMRELGLLAASVMMCDPAARPFGMEPDDDEPDLDEELRREGLGAPPEGPMPPMPPAPPRHREP